MCFVYYLFTNPNVVPHSLSQNSFLHSPLHFTSERVPLTLYPPTLRHQVSTRLGTFSPTEARQGYICAGGLRPAHVCSLVGGLVSGNSQSSGLVAIPFNCKILHPSQSVTGRASQRTTMAPVCQHNVASVIVSGFGTCTWEGSQVWLVTGWPFLQSLLRFCHHYFF